MSKRKHATEMGFKQAVYLHPAGRLAEAEQIAGQPSRGPHRPVDPARDGKDRSPHAHGQAQAGAEKLGLRHRDGCPG